MKKIGFKDLSGWLRFAAFGAIVHAVTTCIVAFVIISGMLIGLFL